MTCYLLLRLLFLNAGAHKHGCGRHIPVVTDSKLRRLLDNLFVGLSRPNSHRHLLQGNFGSGPSSSLKQTKAVYDIAWKDLEETIANADKFAQPQKGRGRTGGDRHLLQGNFGSGPSSSLKQTKVVSDIAWKDLEETIAAADKFAQPQKGRGRTGDRRMLGLHHLPMHKVKAS